MGFDSDRIYLTKNAVEHAYIDSIKPSNTNYDACFCGIISKMKGVYDLVEIWEGVIKSGTTSKLLIIGEGPELDNLVTLIQSRSLDKNIFVAGFLTEEQKIANIKSSKVFVFPSYQEGWGIVVLEAMACEVPVVCYNLAAYDVFADGIVKASVGDKKKMVTAVLKLLQDEKTRSALAKKAKEASRKLNWQDIAAEELERISKLMEV